MAAAEAKKKTGIVFDSRKYKRYFEVIPLKFKTILVTVEPNALLLSLDSCFKL